MKTRFFFILFLISWIEALDYVLINCSWPCPNPAQGCVITNTEAFCGNRESNRWMMNSVQKAPFFTGAYVSLKLQPCQIAPKPTLPLVSPAYNTTTAGESVIQWPIPSLHRPYDAYLGNCGHGLYCSSTGEDAANPVCRARLDISDSCISSNQCISRHCENNTCQPYDNTTKKDQPYSKHIIHPHHTSTGHILAAVFGTFGAIFVATLCYFAYRHRKNKKQHPIPESQVQTQFASDFEQEDYYKVKPPSYKA